MLRRVDRECDGRQHEQNRGDGRRLGQRRGRASRTKGGLAALTAKSGGNVPSAATLQQDHDDQEEAHDYVHNSDENDHEIEISLTC